MGVIGQSNQIMICTPLIERDSQSILAELDYILDKNPDIIEWRADFFAEIADVGEIIHTAEMIKQKCKDIPLIFTARSVNEGGRYACSDDNRTLDMFSAICTKTSIEYIDYELSSPPGLMQKLRRIATENNTKIIASFHDFHKTPERETLWQKVYDAKNNGADVAKIAVMSHSLDDVLTLLSFTWEVKKSLDIPIITMAMGQCGALTRMIGGVFGSALTFGLGRNSSAPGQIPVEDLRKVLEVINKSIGPGSGQ